MEAPSHVELHLHHARTPSLAEASGIRAPTPGCFLCAYSSAGAASPMPCQIGQVEGRILRVVEHAARDGSPLVTLACADGACADILLTRDDRAFVRLLATLSPEHLKSLTLRVFHLLERSSGPTSADVVELPTSDALPAANGELSQSARVALRTTSLSVSVLEPDSPLNITDINNAEYCVRQYPLRRMASSAPTAATLKGTIIHQAFKELLKSGLAEPTDRATYLAQAARAQLIDLALRQISLEDITAEAEPHMRALGQWYRSQRSALWSVLRRTQGAQGQRDGIDESGLVVDDVNRPEIRTETFLLAPEVGLRGRLDALLREAHGASLLELKTGQTHGNLPKNTHRWQVYGYQT